MPTQRPPKSRTHRDCTRPPFERIAFSSRTRASTDQFKTMQRKRQAADKLLREMPQALRQTPEAGMLPAEADHKVYNPAVLPILGSEPLEIGEPLVNCEFILP